MKVTTFCILLAGARLGCGADFAGDWIAEVVAKGAEPQFARVQLRTEGTRVTGAWNELKVEGAVTGDRINLSLVRNGAPAGTLTGVGSGGTLSGEGKLSRDGRGNGGGEAEPVTWKLTRPAQPPAGKPRTIDFEPTVFHGYYSASIPPVLHIFPGETVRTRTYDQSGRDADRRTPGGNLETGPFYVEGALPGDTLAVKLIRVRLNRDSARQGSRINGHAATLAWVAAAKYDSGFDGEWRLDREKGLATLAHPTPRMKNFSVPILPMLGCISTAPPATNPIGEPIWVRLGATWIITRWARG
jgi:amidase